MGSPTRRGVTVRQQGSANVKDWRAVGVCCNYRTGDARHERLYDSRGAWFVWKPVAHLCAAYVDFAFKSNAQAPFINAASLAELEGDMTSFLVTAYAYKAALSGTAESMFAPQTLKSMQ
jgi:hypothetical protein